MKSAHRVLQNKQSWSDSNRNRRSGRWGLNVTERKSQCSEINVQQLDRPSATDVKTAQTSANAANILTRSRYFTVQSKHSIHLPPISGSRIISGKAECTAVPLCTTLPNGNNTQLSISSVMKENRVIRVLAARQGKGFQMSNKSKKISGTLTARNKEVIQDGETCSRLIKRTFDAQPAELRQQTNDSVNPSANDSGVMTPAGIEKDASLCKARKQRDFCLDDSAIETESEQSEDKGRPETGRASLCPDEDKEYYTDQRITEWVLKVNSSLFSTSNDELDSSNPAEEQDIATIKIIYNSD